MHSRALAYSREVYTLTMDWYRVADSKGQLLLTLNGVYITVLSSIAIASSQDLLKRGDSLPLVTWLLLAGTAVATAVSVLSAIACLHSRLSNARLDSLRDSFTEVNAQGSVHYRPAATYWFGTIARLDRSVGLAMLRQVDEAFELSALTEEVFLLAPNVLVKHRWANRGWASAGASLLFLLAAAVSAVVAV